MVKSTDEHINGIPKEGFLKLSRPDHSSIDPGQRTALIRKGNEFFNAGKIEQAKRIFMATGYGDGLIRIGDYCLGKKDPLEALRMYWVAPAPKKLEKLIEDTADVLKTWMYEGKSKNEERTIRRNGSEK